MTAKLCFVSSMPKRSLSVAACLSGCWTVTADTLVKTETTNQGECETTKGVMTVFPDDDFCLGLTPKTESALIGKSVNDVEKGEAAVSDWDTVNKELGMEGIVKGTSKFAFVKEPVASDPGHFVYATGNLIKQALQVNLNGKDLCFHPRSGKYSMPDELEVSLKAKWSDVTLDALKAASEFAWVTPSQIGGSGAFIYKMKDESGGGYKLFELL